VAVPIDADLVAGGGIEHAAMKPTIRRARPARLAGGSAMHTRDVLASRFRTTAHARAAAGQFRHVHITRKPLHGERDRPTDA
jgi:hypothetical protein